MQTNPSTISQVITSRPAPLLPGFYSIQALSEDGVLPLITQYHRKSEAAIRWKNAMAKRRLFDAYALCSSDTRWDIYGRSGKNRGVQKSVTPESGIFMEQHNATVVDRDEYEDSVKDILGKSVRCLTFAEHHAHASSVGHSNMVVVARQMIMDASDADLEHVYLADSIASGCRVQGWFINTSALSEELMDKYLDRHKWLTNGWPLANDHHLQVMAYRMATLRPMQILGMLLCLADVVNLGEHKRQILMRIQDTHPEALILFASSMMEGLESAVVISGPQDLEEIDSDVIITHAGRIAELYRDTFLQ